ncbi:MAG TPA: cytochrome c biogenesis protein CcsA, partial [Cellvibrionaceae bacterium]|nr:cytochrome c biogenesis protein CcsA [Cellvibrionaceae bacterium]
AQKTVFSLMAWATYALLLWGRHAWGWRGAAAMRWTFTGFAFLLLAYFGSKFVLELILQRA